MVGSYLLQMNLRSGHGGIGSGHGSTSAGAGRDPENHVDNGHDNANGESHGALLLGPPPPLTPPMTLVEMLAARRDTARALKMIAQAIGGFTRGGHGGNGGNRSGARGLERPCSY
jgi:hypothetical protein